MLKMVDFLFVTAQFFQIFFNSKSSHIFISSSSTPVVTVLNKMIKFIIILLTFVMLINLTIAQPLKHRVKREQKALAEFIDQLQISIVTMTIQVSKLLKATTGKDLTVIYSFHI